MALCGVFTLENYLNAVAVPLRALKYGNCSAVPLVDHYRQAQKKGGALSHSALVICSA